MDLPGLRSVPTQQRSRDTVLALLRAADDQVGTHGVAALSATAVAESAGVSIGRLYYWFEDTDALVAALVGQYRERITAAFAEVVDPGDDVTTPELLGVILHRLADPERLPAAGLELVADGLARPDGPSAALLGTVLEPIEALLEVRTPDSSPGDRAGVAEACLRTALTWLRWARQPDAPTDAVLDELTYLLAAYLYARYPHRDDPVWGPDAVSPIVPSSRPRAHRTGVRVHPARWPQDARAARPSLE